MTDFSTGLIMGFTIGGAVCGVLVGVWCMEIKDRAERRMRLWRRRR